MMSEGELCTAFGLLLDLKANEEEISNKLLACDFPTLANARDQQGDLELGDFVAFFRYFGQEEHWNVPVSEATLGPVFQRAATLAKWNLGQLAAYLKSLTKSMLVEMRYEMKNRQLLLGSFFIMREKTQEMKAKAIEKMHKLADTKQEFCHNLFSVEDKGKWKEGSQQFLQGLRVLGQQLPVQRVGSKYEVLLPNVFALIDKNKDQYIDEQEMATYIDEVLQELDTILASIKDT